MVHRHSQLLGVANSTSQDNISTKEEVLLRLEILFLGRTFFILALCRPDNQKMCARGGDGRTYSDIVIHWKLAATLVVQKQRQKFYNPGFIGHLFLKMHLNLLICVIIVKELEIFLGNMRCL